MILLCRKSYIVWWVCRQCRQQRYGWLRRRGFQQRLQRRHTVKLHQLLLDQNYTKIMTNIKASASGMVSIYGFTFCNYHSLREFAGICMLGLNSEKGMTNIFIKHYCWFTFKWIYQPLKFKKLPFAQRKTWESGETLIKNDPQCWAALGGAPGPQRCCTEQCSCETEPLNLRTAAKAPGQEWLLPDIRSLLTNLEKEGKVLNNVPVLYSSSFWF